MKIEPLRHPSPNPRPKMSPKPDPVTFGILKGWRPTSYGQYMWGEYKGYKIDVYDATKKYNQKLIYISNKNTLKWIKSKLIYLNKGIAKILRSEA